MSASFPGATQGYGSSSPMSMDVIPTQTMPGGDIYSQQGQFLYNANNPLAGMGGGQMSPDLQAYYTYFDQMYKPGMNSDQIRNDFYAMTPEQRASYATPGNQYAGMGIAPSQDLGVRESSLGKPGLVPPELMGQQPPGPGAQQPPQQTPITDFSMLLTRPFRLPAELMGQQPPGPPPFPTLQQNPAFSQPGTTQPNISYGMSDEQLMAIVKPGFRDLQQPAPPPATQPGTPQQIQNIGKGQSSLVDLLTPPKSGPGPQPQPQPKANPFANFVSRPQPQPQPVVRPTARQAVRVNPPLRTALRPPTRGRR